jgi:hypothetical protein
MGRTSGLTYKRAIFAVRLHPIARRLQTLLASYKILTMAI